MQIIVLGMHRSGTSAVARLLNMMGAYFAGENTATMPPTEANPKGYWEREDVRQLNESIISSLYMSWDNISDFESNLLTEEVQQRFQSQAAPIIFNLENHRPWMVKDPRFCLLFPLWRSLLEIPVCVYVYRRPIQVAQSLSKRENFSLTLGIALWEKYNLYGLMHSAMIPRVLISHEDLLRDPVAEVNKLHQALLECEVQGLRLPSEREIRAFIDPQLFRERGDAELQDAYVNRQQALLVEAFENKTILQLDPLPALSGGAREVLQEYRDKLIVRQEALMLQQEIGTRDQEIVKCHQEIAQREAEIAQKTIEINGYAEEIARQSQLIAELETLVAERDVTLVQQTEEFSRLQHSLKEELANALGECQQQKLESAKHQAQTVGYRNQLRAIEAQADKLKKEVAELSKREPELQAQIVALRNNLGYKEQSTAELNKKLGKQHQYINQLLHWIEGLHTDIQAVFNSFTWRSGNVLTQITLRLMLKKSGPTAQDHIKEIMANVSALRSQQAAAETQTIPIVSSSTISTVVEAPSHTPVITTPLLPSAHLLHLDPRNYPRWVKNYDVLTSKSVKKMQQLIQEWDYCPLISIVMPTYNTEERWLKEALDSVLQQIYPYWELCIADDASSRIHVRSILEEYAQRDERIKLKFREENGHISAASNSALEMVRGEFVTFLDHDDTLAPAALFWVVQDIHDYPDAMLWYSDEDKINESNERYEPYFKCDWNPDLFLSHNLITHLAVYRTAVIQKIAGFREGYEGAQDYDLALRAIDQIAPIQIRHIPRILYHWRAISGSTASRPDEKPYAILAAQKAITEFLGRRNIDAQVMESPDIAGTIRVRYALPTHLPLVSLIIPTRNSLDLLRQCVDSILHRTDYSNFEILIINNNSDDPETLAYMHQLEERDQARIIDYPHPFNYADMNNMAVEHAQGELVGLLNNDIEVINSEWLSEMVSHALRPEVGVVGARLWYPNETLQHGGVILGIGGVAGHSHKGFPRGDVGYFGRAGLIQNFSAVTGACMVMRKTNFLGVGGLDAENLSTAFNDVDLCLKMNRYGLRIVWTPYAELYHHESASRGYEDTPEKIARFEKERIYMKQRWPNFIAADPAYSPNLTLETQDFAFAWPPRIASLP